MDEWVRTHALVGPPAVFAITYGLWVKLGLSLREAMDSSIVDFAVMFYAALAALVEGGGMFYALAYLKRGKRKLADERREIEAEGRAEGRVSVLAELEASIQDGETVEEFLSRLRKEMNGDSTV